MVEVITSVVKSELSFFEMEVEGVPGDAVELCQSPLRIALEGLDAIDVRLEVGELIVVVPHAQVLGIAHIHQAVVASPAVTMDDAGQVHLAPNRLEQRGFLGVGNNLRVDMAVAFEDAEDDRLPPGPTTALAANPFRAEVRFVDFDFSTKGRLLFAPLGNAASDFKINIVDPTHRKSRQLSCVGRRQIQGKRSQQPTKSCLADSGTPIVSILARFHRTKCNSLRP